MTTFNWIFEYQSIVLEILTQPFRNLLEDEKGPHHWNQIVVWVIHLYLYIYCPIENIELFCSGFRFPFWYNFQEI